MPDLHPNNQDAWEVYQYCQGQYIMSSAGPPIDINMSAVIDVIDLLNIDNRLDCFERVVRTARSIINDMNQDYKMKQLENKSKVKRPRR